MKIAIILRPNDQAPPPRYGGCGRVVYLLAKGLLEKKHKVILYTAKPSTLSNFGCEIVMPLGIIKEKYENDIGAHRWVGYIAKTIDHIKKLELQGKGYDIINNHYDPIAFVLGRYLKTPMLTTIHGVANDENLRSFYIYPDENFSALTCIQRDKYPKDMNFVGIVHNSISVNKIDHPFSDKKCEYLFSVSRIKRNKGQANAIEFSRKSGLDLIIAGNLIDRYYFDMEIRPHITRDLSDLKSKEREKFIWNIQNYSPSKNKREIIYVEEVTEQERDQIMQYAKALLFLGKGEESHPLVTLEAGIVGTSILALNRSVIPEIIKPGTNGFIGNTIDELVGYVSRLDEIDPRYCRRYIEDNFNPDKMVDGYMELYKKVIDNAKR
ncbi:MAG: glycosyltransferase [Nanoarchaeota archaeon]|nr:glycosyltransferase [Nanoarchaeota archaeon]MBU4283958.1 glycosyltransferase [Nanoarchaeota archaeon]MBU4493567.1 glycosyltransferase [Nanoarchaeota archaeon]